jgi:hypothetical protein
MVIEFVRPVEKVFKEPIYFHDGSGFHPYSELSDNQINIIHSGLREHPKALIAIKHMQNSGITGKRHQLARFIQCNWGSLDNIPDISDDGTMNFERVECVRRNSCRDRGVICIIK